MKIFLLLLCMMAVISTNEMMAAKATHYAGSLVGRPMANTKPYNPFKYTCASWDYPLGTLLMVTNKENGREVIVEVTDRHDYKTDIDLSFWAYTELRDWAWNDSGRIDVKIEEVK